MTSEYIRPLIASFPWLTESEASGVAAALPSPDPATPAADHMSHLAVALDNAGLLATSTLLLALSHGSKSTAVAVARRAARTRFERAGAATAHLPEVNYGRTPSRAPGPTPAPRDPYIDEDELRRCIQATVEDVVAKLPGAFGASDSDRIVPILEGLAGEVRWLRSTIDTERQLRRYREAHGPLPEHLPPQGAASAADRRSVVAGLASSLEQQRFTSHVAPSMDMADGREE